MYRRVLSIGLALGACVACAEQFDEATTEELGQTEQALTGNYVPFAESPVPGQSGVTFTSGAVRASVVVGSRIYLGGDFTLTKGTTTYKNLAAFELSADANVAPQLVSGFNPKPNGAVYALATDGQDQLFVGGSFTKIGANAESKNYLAAMSLSTGGVISGFQVDVSGSIPNCGYTCRSGDPFLGGPGVHALAMAGMNLIVGGNFSTVKGATRNGLAAVDAYSYEVNGNAFKTGVEGGFVSSIAFDILFNSVYIGGTFLKIEGTARNCMASFFPDGTIRSPTFTQLKCKAGVDSKNYWQVKDIAVDMEHGRVYIAMGGRGVASDGTNPTNRVFAYGDVGSTYLWKSPSSSSTPYAGDVQAVDYHNHAVYFGVHDGIFTNGNPEGTNGDPYKVAALDLDTGKMLNDGLNKTGTCSSSSPTPLASRGGRQGDIHRVSRSHRDQPLRRRWISYPPAPRWWFFQSFRQSVKHCPLRLVPTEVLAVTSAISVKSSSSD